MEDSLLEPLRGEPRPVWGGFGANHRPVISGAGLLCNERSVTSSEKALPPPTRSSSYSFLSDLWLKSLVPPAYPHPGHAPKKEGERPGQSPPPHGQGGQAGFRSLCSAVSGQTGRPTSHPEPTKPPRATAQGPGRASFCSRKHPHPSESMATSESGPWTSYSWAGWLICGGLARWGLRKHRGSA